MRDSVREGIFQVLSILVSFRSMHNVFQTQSSIQNHRVETWKEIVSMGDTEISLHIRAPSNSGGGGTGVVKTKKLKVPSPVQISISLVVVGGRG